MTAMTVVVIAPGAESDGSQGLCAADDMTAVARVDVFILVGVFAGYQPGCMSLESGGLLRIMDADPSLDHDPADEDSRGAKGTCFSFQGERDRLTSDGDVYDLKFQNLSLGGLEVSKNGGRTWRPCNGVTYQPDGDAILVYGCSIHELTGQATLIVQKA